MYPDCVEFLLVFKAQQRAHSELCNRRATPKTSKKASNVGTLFVARCLSTYQVRPSIRTFVMLEPSAWKQACSVLRELGGGDAARLPGGFLIYEHAQFLGVSHVKLYSCDGSQKISDQFFSDTPSACATGQLVCSLSI